MEAGNVRKRSALGIALVVTLLILATARHTLRRDSAVSGRDISR